MIHFRVVVLLVLILAPVQFRTVGQAAVPLDQSILIADQGNNRIIEVTPGKLIAWEYDFDNLLPQQGPSSAYFSPDHTRIVASLQNVVVIIDYATRQIVWQYGDWVHEGTGTNLLSGPQDAHILANNSVSIADTKNCRILIISPEKQIVKQYGQTGACVSKPNDYYFPNNAAPIAGGQFLITESVGSRITQMDADGNELNSIKSPALLPSKAQLTPRNTIIVADDESQGAALYELDPTATVLWQYGPFDSGDAALSSPSFAAELPNSNVITADTYNHRVIVIDKATKAIVWQYGAAGSADSRSLSLPTSVDWRRNSPPMVTVPVIGTAPAQTVANSLPGQATTKIRTDFFSAQVALGNGDVASAVEQIANAQHLYQQALAPDFAKAVPALSSAITADFAALSKAATAGNFIQLTALRSSIWTEILQGSTAIIDQALKNKDALTARTWLLVRDFRTPTRISHPNADATLAVNQFLHGEQTAEEARLNVRSDLLDTYQSLLKEALLGADAAMGKGFIPKWVEQAALAQGYWRIIAPTYEGQYGLAASRTAADSYRALVQAAMADDPQAFKQARTQVELVLQDFQADPLYQAKQAQHCHQFTALLSMVSLEYASGVYTGAIVDSLDIQEAIALHGAALISFDDIKPIMNRTDSQNIQGLLDTLGTQVNNNAPSAQVDQTIAQISGALGNALPSICQPVAVN